MSSRNSSLTDWDAVAVVTSSCESKSRLIRVSHPPKQSMAIKVGCPAFSESQLLSLIGSATDVRIAVSSELIEQFSWTRNILR